MAAPERGTPVAELHISWDGTASGLAEHRLSLGEFGQPLTLLLTALRRIATQMVQTAVEGEHPKVGRFTQTARQLDIEIVNIAQSSAGIDAVVVFHPDPTQTLPLFGGLVERAANDLLDSIERESKGEAANGAVRTYLRSLPPGVNRQQYIFRENGKEHRVDIGDMKIAEIIGDLPLLEKFEGNVIGVGFDPGRNEVRIRTENIASTSLATTPEAVETALRLRHDTVRVLGVRQGTRARLLNIQRASEPPFRLTEDGVEEHIFKRWGGLLERLAK